jgi:hypothetical protein
MHWSYLNSHSERLHQVLIGDFDGDRGCDVFAVHGNSWDISSGDSKPWVSLGNFGIPLNELKAGDFNGDGRKDIFRRNSSGQWSVISPGVHGWRLLQSSGFPLSSLKFGDFNGDRKTDVLSLAGGHWSVSWDGLSTWQNLNSLTTAMPSVVVADFNGNGIDDVLTYSSLIKPDPKNPLNYGKWKVAWDGRGGYVDVIPPTYGNYWFWGRFDNKAGSDGLVLNIKRESLLISQGSISFVRHGKYAY